MGKIKTTLSCQGLLVLIAIIIIILKINLNIQKFLPTTKYIFLLWFVLAIVIQILIYKEKIIFSLT